MWEVSTLCLADILSWWNQKYVVRLDLQELVDDLKVRDDSSEIQGCVAGVCLRVTPL